MQEATPPTPPTSGGQGVFILEKAIAFSRINPKISWQTFLNFSLDKL